MSDKTMIVSKVVADNFRISLLPNESSGSNGREYGDKCLLGCCFV
jgi:hypothetical protein